MDEEKPFGTKEREWGGSEDKKYKFAVELRTCQCTTAEKVSLVQSARRGLLRSSLQINL